MTDKIERTDTEWRQLLTRDQYEVCRRKGTEPAFSGEHVNNRAPGQYRCVCCGAPLFDTETKFDSGTGWPSFYRPIDTTAVEQVRDGSHGMIREEVVCAKCDAHLGHVFNDGPNPTGLRYCINSVALVFEQEEENQS